MLLFVGCLTTPNMSRIKNPVYIAEGFNEDCGALIDILTDKYKTVDWQNFCHHWKEMEFDKLFFGRQSGPELVELTEEYLQIARLYIVTETDNFEQQVAGVFIAYALILIQPYKDLCALRLIPDDAGPLKKIEAIARRDDRKDLLMALGKLYVFGHTQFHVSLRERSMDKCIRKYFDSALNVPKCIARRWHGYLGRNVISALDKTTQKESEYARLKMIAKATAEDKLPGVKVRVDMYQPEQPSMADSLRRLTDGPKEEDKHDDEDLITSIKKKAMKQVVDPIKHLHGLSERKKGKEKIVINSLSPSKAKARNRRLKLLSPDPENDPPPNPEENLCLSLPALDAPAIDDIAKRRTSDREHSPEAVFRGFTAKEIKNTQSSVNLPANPMEDNTLSHPHRTKSPRSKTKVGRGKRKGAAKRKKTLKNKNNKKLKVSNDFQSDSKTDTSLDYSSDESYNLPQHKHVVDDLAYMKTYKGKEPTFLTEQTQKDKEPILQADKDREPTLQAEQTHKDKGPTLQAEQTHKDKGPTLQAEQTHKDREPTLQAEQTHKDREPTLQAEQTHKGKEVTLQTKTGEKHYVEFEMNDIVIRSERDSLPATDIEIEFIDNYNNGNAKFEDVCDVSDDDKKYDNDDVEVIIEPCDVNGETNDDAVEVFEIIDGETSARKGRVSSEEDEEYGAKIEKEMEKILKKDKMNKKKVDRRRKLKQPNLRSKLKKMGILPMASFDDDFRS